MKTITRLLLTCTVLFSCTKEMGPDVLPAPAVQEVKTYTLTVQAGKEGTRALSLDESGALRATWAEGEEVKVHKGTTLLGTLTSQSSGKSTTLSGTITGDIGVGTKLYLDFPNSDYDYSTQDGTLTGIGKTCDYATATVKVTGIEGGTVTTETADFKNLQAIVRFRMKLGEMDLPMDEMSLTVSDYVSPAPSSITISVKPETYLYELYVAIPCYYNEEEEPLTFSYQVKSLGIPYSKNNVSMNLKNGKFYQVTLVH